MTLVLAAMAASTAFGLLAHRRLADGGERLAGLSLTAILWVLAPFVIVFSLPHLEADSSLTVGLALGFVVAAVAGGIAWLAGTRVLRLSRECTGTLILVAVVMNTGYFGLPFTSALLGKDALPEAIAFDSLVSGPLFYVAGFAIGAAFGASGELAARTRVRQVVLRNPPLVAAVIGLLLPASASPETLVDATHVAIWGLLILGFVALGVTLGSEADEGALAFPPRLGADVATAVGLRVAIAPALYVGLTAAAGGAPDAFRVEQAMPVGINSLVVAHATGLDLRLTSSAIAWSTIVVAAWGLVASLA